MDNIALLILGVFISFLGIVNIMGNISTIHTRPQRTGWKIQLSRD